mmetsp:Transcript_4755/g.10572  ORF Transcript_4755/g.10572 Transcript_4755/m.10572 type:complete len:205 (+) Transcript_4755:161-775(+)
MKLIATLSALLLAVGLASAADKALKGTNEGSLRKVNDRELKDSYYDYDYDLKDSGKYGPYYTPPKMPDCPEHTHALMLFDAGFFDDSVNDMDGGRLRGQFKLTAEVLGGNDLGTIILDDFDPDVGKMGPIYTSKFGYSRHLCLSTHWCYTVDFELKTSDMEAISWFASLVWNGQHKWAVAPTTSIPNNAANNAVQFGACAPSSF